MIESRGLLDWRECAQIINIALDKGFKPGTTFSGDMPQAFRKIRRALLAYSKRQRIVATQLPFVTVSRYRVNQFYNWHHDIDWRVTDRPTRKVSVSILLSDPASFKGGNLEFFEISDYKPDKRQGVGTFFPSYLQHRVTPVELGERYAITGWAKGPQWS